MSDKIQMTEDYAREILQIIRCIDAERCSGIKHNCLDCKIEILKNSGYILPKVPF